MAEPCEILSPEQCERIDDRSEKYFQESKALIAEKFGLPDAKSSIFFAVNDKSFPWLNTTEMADLFRQTLGKENIIVLLNGDVII